ncbi:MAG TPA: polyprenyl synthetase family protein [Thermoplasmatales archaeon]|nr:polyprenyl synthetase family protein [Thermoplasmatales archaeon]
MDLKEELEDRLKVFNAELTSFLEGGEPEELYDAIRHLPLAGGKRLRPILSMLSCEAVSGSVEDVLPYAIALELIHNFTLIHDDIMDNSHLRRNIPTVHVKYGESTAILAGDLLFAKAYEALNNLNSRIIGRLSSVLTEAIIEVCEGQKLDMDFEKRSIVSEEEYLTMIKKKTSALFRAAAEGGAIAGGGGEQEVESLRVYGENLGLAFQIRDDYLDMSSSMETLGKDIGNDIRNGKKTLIAVYALTHAEGEEKKQLDRLFGKRDASDEEVRVVYQIFRDTGSLEYAENVAKRYMEKAVESISILEEKPVKQVLKELARFAVEREK